MIHSPEHSARFLSIAQDAEASNQGRATVRGHLPEPVRSMLATAGYRVTLGRDVHGMPCLYVFTPRAWQVTISELNARNRATADRINRAWQGEDY